MNKNKLVVELHQVREKNDALKGYLAELFLNEIPSMYRFRKTIFALAGELEEIFNQETNFTNIDLVWKSTQRYRACYPLRFPRLSQITLQEFKKFQDNYRWFDYHRFNGA
ncbi:Uncharacterised protein [uncultured archaeon]|nr:Uncharacterised protein [uncultured archaeon]